MKRIFNKFRGGEKGQALILALILMLLGGLIIAPLLAYMGTGIKVGKEVHEERMAELYAADAGIEDGVWNIMQPPGIPENGTWTHNITVNGKNVTVTISSQQSAMVDFFVNLGILLNKNGTYNKATPHSDWLVIYTPIESSTLPGVYDTYRVTVYYSQDNPRTVVSTGFWIQGYDGNTEAIPYEGGIGGKDSTVDIDLNGNGQIDSDEHIATKPLIDDNKSYNSPGVYPYPSRITDFMGNAFIWEWNKDGPTLPQKEKVGKDWVYYRCRTQRFKLTPSITLTGDESFPVNVAWVSTQQNDIQISWSGPITGMRKITAVATDPATGKSTTVTSYGFADPVSATILTWDIKLN
jgi:hypothetical protein